MNDDVSHAHKKPAPFTKENLKNNKRLLKDVPSVWFGPLELFIYELKRCKNMNEVNKLIDLWIKVNHLNINKIITIPANKFEDYLEKRGL